MRQPRCAGVFLSVSVLLVLALQYACSSIGALLRTSNVDDSDRQVTVVGINLLEDVQIALEEAFKVQPSQQPEAESSPMEAAGLADEEEAKVMNKPGEEVVYEHDDPVVGNETNAEATGPIVSDLSAGEKQQPEGEQLDADIFLDLDATPEESSAQDMLFKSSEEPEETEEIEPPKETDVPILVIFKKPSHGSSVAVNTNSGGKVEISGFVVSDSEQLDEPGEDDLNALTAKRDKDARGESDGLQASELSTMPLSENLKPSGEIASTILLPADNPAVPSPSLVPILTELPQPVAGTDANSTLLDASLQGLEGGTLEIILPSPPNMGEGNIWVEIPFVLTNISSLGFSATVDHSIRSFCLNLTGTSADSWKLVEMSKGKARRAQEAWLAIYHALLPRNDADDNLLILQDSISEGNLTKHLRQTTNEKSVIVAIAAEPILDVQAGKEISYGQVGSSGSDSEGATVGKEDNDSTESNSANASEGKANRNLAIILGAGLSAVALVIAALAGFVHCRNRDKPGHVLDGIPGVPTTIASLDSSGTGSSRYETGAPMRPRGTQVLRNQSRILDWQLENAEATGNEKVRGRMRMSRRDTLHVSDSAGDSTYIPDPARDLIFKKKSDFSSAQVVD